MDLAVTIVIVLSIYFLPSIIASSRKHKNKESLILTNFFFGWTLLGWIGCLIWSYSSNVEGR